MGLITSSVMSTRAARTSPRRADRITNMSGQSAVGPNWNGRVGKANVEVFRHWSRYSEWIRGAINIRRSQVSSSEWDIVPFDSKRPYSKRLQQQVRELFVRPNPTNISFQSWIEPVIEDVLVLDAGCLEKERNLLGDLVSLWPVNGGEIRVNGLWDGSSPDENRYYWYPDYKLRASFTNDDFVYIMTNPRTDSPVGLSPLETLKLTIETELYGHEYNRRQVAGAAPDGVMDLGEGATPDDVKRYRAYFEADVAGRGAIGFVGGTKNAKWIPFRGNNRDMQFLEWQIYLVRKIAVVMGLTPQDLGVTFDVNRSTAETQIQISEDRGLRPLMATLQEYLTQDVVWDKSFGGPANNLAFRFIALNLKETTAKANINHIALGGVPWKTINEARLEDGRQPLTGKQFDSLVMSTPTGAVSLDDILTAAESMEAKKPQPAPQKEISPDVISLAAVIAAREDGATTRSQSFTDAVTRYADQMAEMAARPLPSAPDVHVAAPVVNITPPQITVEAPHITVEPPAVTVNPPAITVESPTINVSPPQLTIEAGAVQVEVQAPPARTVHRQVQRDADGRITGVTES